ncbi:MAG: hypothetical protein ACRDLB_03210 [Actinomycetota bacterium]
MIWDVFTATRPDAPHRTAHDVGDRRGLRPGDGRGRRRRPGRRGAIVVDYEFSDVPGFGVLDVATGGVVGFPEGHYVPHLSGQNRF